LVLFGLFFLFTIFHGTPCINYTGFALTESNGNPHVRLDISEEKAERLGIYLTSYNVMMASAQNPKDDIFFIGGNIGMNLPAMLAYRRKA